MKNTLFNLIVLSIIIFNGLGQKLTAQVPQADSLALAAIYNTMGGESWTDNTNWLNGSVAAWKGVIVTNGRVTRLDLNSNNLQDSIPAEIGNLTALDYLSMGNNPLSGPIPPEIGALSNLTYLGLYMSGINGSIPSEIGNLIKLERFQMNSCQLEGPIPAEIGNLINLTQLYLSKNKLSGSIPAEIGNLVNLKGLYLYENLLEGSIPVEMANMSSLEILYLSDNLLTGFIPSELSKLNNLTSLNLSMNQLSGVIPTQLGEMIALTNLSLQDNKLSGPIPESIFNLVNLTYLGLHNNQIDGAIPVQIGSLTNLIYLYLNNNQLSGTIPPQIGDLKNLKRLSLGENQLSGTIPPEIGNLENLQHLFLASNNLEGSIPQEINKLRNLISVYIPDNRFDELPALDSLTALGSLNIRDNKFTFEDIEPNLGIPSGSFIYSPQDSIGSRIDTTLQPGANLLLSVFVGGSSNNYQWLKNNIEISGAVKNTYEITSASAADTGSYVCSITNMLATQLTLYSRAAHVNVAGISGLDPFSAHAPKRLVLQQNYPNPFNPITTIRYELPMAAKVHVNIYNVLGQKVAALVSQQQTAGQYQVSWDANGFPSGLYFYQMKTGKHSEVRKMMLLR